MATFFQTYGKELVAAAVPIFIWMLNVLFRARARLQLATPHDFTFLVQEPIRDKDGNIIATTQNAYTRSLTVSNSGNATATKVELVFNWKPLCLNIWPPRHFEEFTEPDNRYTLIFDSLAPNEHIGCHLLSVNDQLPAILTVRSDQCTAQNIYMYPQPHVENWKRRVGVFLGFVGIAATVYGLIVLIQFLVLKTPFGH